MIAINPPVLVPPIKSKYSHGFGVASALVLLSISSIMSRRIKSDDSPLTPPPSRQRILGKESSARDGVSAMRYDPNDIAFGNEMYVSPTDV
jgi:hypothetical protein